MSDGVYISQSRGCSSMQDGKVARIVQLDLSSSPFVCGLYMGLNQFLCCEFGRNA